MAKRRSRLNHRQLNYLAWKRWWTSVRLNAWKTQPEKMEAIRKQATEEAKAVKERKDKALRQIVATWPEKMTTSELKAVVLQSLDYSGRYSSLTYRFTRKGMLRFEADGYWHNLCHLPAV